MFSKIKRLLRGLSTPKKILVGLATFVVVSAGMAGVNPDNRTVTTTAANTQDQIATIINNQKTLAETVNKKQIIDKQVVSYSTSIKNDPSLYVGTEKTLVTGVNGERTVTYEVTYKGDTEISRLQLSDVMTKQPVNEIKAVGTRSRDQSTGGSSCSNGYINTYGNCVASPSSSPNGATAKCRDGTYSYSQSRRGTCSSHGGVASWL